MKKESITIIKLTASEGHILTDGKSHTRDKYLTSDEECDKWYEITEEEYQKAIAANIDNPEVT